MNKMKNDINLSILRADEWYESESITGHEKWIWKFIVITELGSKIECTKIATPIDGYKSFSKLGIWYIKDFKYLNKANMDEVYRLFPEEKKDKSIDLLAEAKIRYPVGTKYKSRVSGDEYTINDSNFYYVNNKTGIRDNSSTFKPWIYYKSKWAEIISTPDVSINSKQLTELNDKPVLMSLPSKWCIKVNDDNRSILDRYRSKLLNVNLTYSLKCWLLSDSNYDNSYISYNTDQTLEGYTEITFEEFNKWVLNKQSSEGVILDFKANSTCEPDIYVTSIGNIYKWNGIKSDYYIGIDNNSYKVQDCFKIGNGRFSPMTDKKASFSERQWLDACFKANKFISKEEALKSDKPGINTETFKAPLKMSDFDISPFICYGTSNDSKIKDFSDYWRTDKNPCDFLTGGLKYKGFDLEEYTWPIWENGLSIQRDIKLNDLEFQQPVIIKNNKKKSKLITIKQ